MTTVWIDRTSLQEALEHASWNVIEELWRILESYDISDIMRKCTELDIRERIGAGVQK